MLKEQHNIDAIAERVTRKEPANNRRMRYDKFSEPLGIEILPQEDIFCGWSIKRKETK
jgi:hypothetical protein